MRYGLKTLILLVLIAPIAIVWAYQTYIIVIALVPLVGFAVALVTTATSSNAIVSNHDTASKETAGDVPDKNVCSISAADWTGRKGMLQELSKGVIHRNELENGFAWGFPAENKWYSAITKVVFLERTCCESLSYKIIVEANQGPIWLEISGPEGTKEFLSKSLGFESESRPDCACLECSK